MYQLSPYAIYFPDVLKCGVHPGELLQRGASARRACGAVRDRASSCGFDRVWDSKRLAFETYRLRAAQRSGRIAGGAALTAGISLQLQQYSGERRAKTTRDDAPPGSLSRR